MSDIIFIRSALRFIASLLFIVTISHAFDRDSRISLDIHAALLDRPGESYSDFLYSIDLGLGWRLFDSDNWQWGVIFGAGQAEDDTLMYNTYEGLLKLEYELDEDKLIFGIASGVSSFHLNNVDETGSISSVYLLYHFIPKGWDYFLMRLISKDIHDSVGIEYRWLDFQNNSISQNYFGITIGQSY